MRLHWLPFLKADAYADISTGDVYVSSLDQEKFDANIKHEFAHIISKDADHGHQFRQVADELGVSVPHGDEFKNIRKWAGIPTNIAANIGNISGIQNILTDYHLLQAYRKFSQKVLATEGHWEVLNEGGSAGATGDQINAANQLIRLYPTPKGAFPVVVLYIPVITHFRSPQARKLAYDYMEAEAKIAVGSARRKVTNMPSPDGGSLGWDGGDLVSEGIKAKEEIIKMAIDLGEPMLPAMWSVLPLLFGLINMMQGYA